ncbi:ABC transporter ATP-binding protein [Verticiella sediminum]|uniref:ABC transporter ATP-binding protein n=1 Tax=Verticiella sediminum TaxID=1247510 RepID=A0A556AYS0_9BURK|nr:ABC transporter ATP-binding protein [Verticiella sediminum]TSH98068.1 ABC transporter ATP-binding protein [Verticiella sediminum]
MQHVIDLDALTQTFRSSDGSPVTALQGVDLHLRRHEFVSLIGPSGCGKSTILRLISGLLLPSSGAVRVFEQPVTEPRDDIGLVFQKPTLLPWLSVLENITFPMRHKYGRVSPSDTARAQELLAMVGLSDFSHKRPDELSGGMQQRVSIARSLLHDPDILLMDEPFSALDALTRDEMSFELLRIWNERPKTVVFVTHSIQEALLLSDRIVVMSARPGRVADIIDVPLERPRNLATLADPVFTRMANDIRVQVFSRKPD